ncbi:emb-27 [Pristionchus pacificus]|uniref:Emb-27 n=1 Tax=Pristionchus pacificus TaxID=54126 RepID=A0A2A6CZQ5_PRIPA|nr:emb-27 [Pristionchus pacificus]|eukprot:PDM83645.1 emb-27 [Pristionchus pacificus]
MISHLAILLLSSTALAQFSGPVPYGMEEPQGPVLRTGRHRIVHDRILGQEHYGNTYNDRPFEQETEGEGSVMNRGGQHFTYDGPIEGRKLYIYKRVHTPVRITDGVVEKVGEGQLINTWAEGGYKSAQRHNLNVFHRIGNDVYAECGGCLFMRSPDKEIKGPQFELVTIKMEEEDTFEPSDFPNHDVKFLDVDPQTAEEQVEKFLRMGDMQNVEYWTDRLFAVSWTRELSSWNRYSKLLQYLARCQKYLRIIAICEHFNLHTHHILFMHYYTLALTERKLYQHAISVPCAQFLLEDDSIDLTDVPLQETNTLTIVDPEFAHELGDTMELDIFAIENNLRSGLLLSLGRSFLQTENRIAAGKCLLAAHRLNKANLMAENLLVKYHLLLEEDREVFMKYRKTRRDANPVAASRDPRELVHRANELYDDGDILEANKMTTKLIDSMGLYQDAILIHIATLVQLGEAHKLFLLAHRLVDAQPDCEMSWYAVSLYYYVCKNIQAAKSFMNKATTMNECFGEGWIAFGHILAYDCEHEQAMNCYLRAVRVLKKRFEPLLYIAMGQCYTNNFKLASDFCDEACLLGETSPIVWHEKGTLLYAKKNYSVSLECFMRAMTIITRSEEGTSLEELIHKPLDPFWEPLMNNLGHANRKLYRYTDAIACYNKALLLVPQQVTTLTSLAFAYACIEKYEMATQYFHQALAIKPFSQFAKAGLDALITEQAHLTVEETRKKMDGSLTLDELKGELHSARDPFMNKANKMVCENMKRDFVPRRHPNLLCRCEECGGCGPDEVMVTPSTSRDDHERCTSTS